MLGTLRLHGRLSMSWSTNLTMMVRVVLRDLLARPLRELRLPLLLLPLLLLLLPARELQRLLPLLPPRWWLRPLLLLPRQARRALTMHGNAPRMELHLNSALTVNGSSGKYALLDSAAMVPTTRTALDTVEPKDFWFLLYTWTCNSLSVAIFTICTYLTLFVSNYNL